MRPRGAARIAARIAAPMRPRGAVRMRPRGGATARRTGWPTPRRATAPQDPATAPPDPAAARDQAAWDLAAARDPAARDPAARHPAAARRPAAHGPRHAPARTGRYAAPSPGPPGPPRRAARKPGLVAAARTAWAAGASTGNLRLPLPLREPPRGRLRPHRARPPRTTQHSRPAAPSPPRRTRRGDPAHPHRARPPPTTQHSRPAAPSPPRRTRRGCRAHPPCRTADRDCPAGPDRSTPPGAPTAGHPPPGPGSPGAPRVTDDPCHKDLPRRGRRRRTRHGRTTRATRRLGWPSPVSRRARAAPPRSRPVHPGMAAGVAPSAATRRGRASLTPSTRRASSPRGTAPLRAPYGLVPPAGLAVPQRPRGSPGTRPSR
jgi:hypothetical protein